jgi:DNA-binding MarR family transcriptional regulator
VESDGGPALRGGALALTPAGLALHDRLVEAAAERQRRLLAGFSAEERAQFASYIARMTATAEDL